MIKRALHLFFILILLTGVSYAKAIGGVKLSGCKTIPVYLNTAVYTIDAAADTTKTKRQQEAEDKKKIKEIAKAKRQAKPEKITVLPLTDTLSNKLKLKRQRRPDGLERPPEIPRRNNN